MLKFKKMGSEKIPLLLITANVGSIFESPSIMLPVWIAEFLSTVSKMEPKFIGLHMQEVGGKTYEKSMQYVQDFITRLCESPELRLFDKIRIYLDEDYSSAEKFTALGNVYFIHSSLSDVKMWDFLSSEWVLVEGKEVHTGNIEKVSTKEKAKFPQHFFPECKWSRKGFLRVRWLIRSTAFELVNVHLFHDASNMLAVQDTPSVYCRSRRRALRHTLQHLHQDPRQPPFFIFGDFNFRLDTAGIVKKLTENLITKRAYKGNSTEASKLQYRSQSDDKLVLSVGKKEFTHIDHQKVFKEPWVLKFDKELEALKPHLYEFPIKFAPTYPYEENIDLPTHYMKTRCPAWCDRILLSQTARLIINHLDGQKLVPRDLTESRRSIVEQMDGVLKHGSRRSIAESTDSGGGSPSKGSQRSSGHSSSESSPARSASPNKYMATHQTNASPVRKPVFTEFEGLSVPGIAQSRKSIADPTNIVHAMNARANEIAEGSPTKRRLVRNQSEGSPKMSERIELKNIADNNNPSLRKRVEYGIIGENACMGDHKPVYLRLMLQSDKGIVRCCMQNDPDKYCYVSPPEIQSETCFRHPSAQNLIKCPSRECFEPLAINSFRSRLASQISYDSGFRGLSPKDKPSSLVRLGTDPSLVRLNRDNLKSDLDKVSSIKNLVHCNSKDNVKSSIGDFDESGVIPIIQINITDADYISFDGIAVNNIDTHFLYTAAIPLDPYTPESLESRSPYPECSNDGTDSDKQSFSNIPINENVIVKSGFESKDQIVDESSFYIKKCHSMDREYVLGKDRSVSPRQLKSRLENILKSSRSSLEISDSSNEDKVDIESDDRDDGSRNKSSEKIKNKTQSKYKCFGCNLC